MVSQYFFRLGLISLAVNQHVLFPYLFLRTVQDERILGSLSANHYIFVGVVGLVVFQSSGWLAFVKMLFSRWLSFSKMQFCLWAFFVRLGSYGLCRHPSFICDLVGC